MMIFNSCVKVPEVTCSDLKTDLSFTQLVVSNLFGLLRLPSPDLRLGQKQRFTFSFSILMRNDANVALAAERNMQLMSLSCL